MARFKKKAVAEGRTIVFVDESGLSERPTVVRTWAPVGQTPQLEFSFRWNHLSVIAGVTWWNFYFRLHEGAIRGPQAAEFLGQLRRQARHLFHLRRFVAGVEETVATESDEFDGFGTQRFDGVMVGAGFLHGSRTGYLLPGDYDFIANAGVFNEPIWHLAGESNVWLTLTLHSDLFPSFCYPVCFSSPQG